MKHPFTDFREEYIVFCDHILLITRLSCFGREQAAAKTKFVFTIAEYTSYKHSL